MLTPRVSAEDESPVMRELASRVGGRDLFEWIEERARHLANLGRTSDGAVRVNRRLRSVCGIESITPDAMSARAELRADGERYTIRFNRALPQEVQRFSIAHEIGHTLWMNGALGHSVKNLSTTVGLRNRTIEMLCDYFAGALLMPDEDVKRLVEHHAARGVSRGRYGEELECPLELIPRLADRFRVQRRIAAWRLLVVQRLASWAVIRVEKHHGRLGELPLGGKEPERRGWETTWYETGTLRRKLATVEGYGVPFGTPRRRIPIDMVPDEVTGETRPQLVDSRWWDGVRPQPIAQARIPFRLRDAVERQMGLATRLDDAIYIAVNREQTPSVSGPA